MPAKSRVLERVAQKLGFEKVRHKRSRARWQHPDKRVITIPTHGSAEIDQKEVLCLSKIKSA